MEKNAGIAPEAEDMGTLSEGSRVVFNSTGIDWTADGTDNAGWTTKSYREL